MRPVGDLQERVLRRPHARELDRRLEDPAVRRDVEEERAELLADPEGPVGGADERLRVEVEAGQDPRRRVAAARRRGGGERVEREAGERRSPLRVAGDRPRDAPVGVVEDDRPVDRGAGGVVPAGIDPVEDELEVGRVRPPGVAVVGERPPRPELAGHHAREALDRLRGEVGPAGRAADAVGGGGRPLGGGEERPGRRRAGPERGGREDAAGDEARLRLGAARGGSRRERDSLSSLSPFMNSSKVVMAKLLIFIYPVWSFTM